MSEQSVEQIIFENLINDDEYFRIAIPHLTEDYFETKIQKSLFKFISIFSERHNKAPNQKILGLMAKEFTGFDQDEYNDTRELIDSLTGREENRDWLVERTEKFCRDKSLFNAIYKSIKIMEGEEKDLNKEAIPSLLQDALAISFDKQVGHDFYEDAASRYEFYHLKEDRIPFRLEMLNRVTKGGAAKKTLNAVLAGINVGKSLFLCDIAASSLYQGHNVLYITLEMAEEKIAERIDCNLLDIKIDDLARMKKEDFISGINGIKGKSSGQLIIKEYPTCGAHVGHFRALLEELKLKKNFIPDVICVDYINICASQKYKSTNYNSYFAIKAIAEELRGLMVEYNCVGWTATQLTRTGYGNSDFDMTDTSESFGLPAALDFFIGIIRTDELDALGQLMVKQLKSRYNDPNYYKKFVIGVDISKFKLYDVDESQQQSISDRGKTDEPLFDKSRNTRDLSGIQFD